MGNLEPIVRSHVETFSGKGRAMNSTVMSNPSAVQDTLFGESKVTHLNDLSPDSDCFCICGCRTTDVKVANSNSTDAVIAVNRPEF